MERSPIKRRTAPMGKSHLRTVTRISQATHSRVNPLTFRTEREMTAPALSWLEGLGLRVKSEFATPWGICDLMGARLRAPSVRKRLKLGQKQPLSTGLRLLVLDSIPRGHAW